VIRYSLLASLEAVSAAIDQHRVDHRDVLALVAELARLPANAYLWVSAEIASIGRFHSPAAGWPWQGNFLQRLQPEFTMLRDTPGLEYLCLFHANGYLREAALAKIDGPITSAFYFNCIAYRLNDWVGAVRRAAQACAARVFPQTPPEIVAEAAVVLLERSRHWQRWGDEAAILEATFVRPDVAERLASWMATARTGAPTRVLREMLRRDAVDVHLLFLFRTAVQPTVRALALRTLIQGRARYPDGFERQWVDKSMGRSRQVVRYHERPVDRPIAIEALIAYGARDRCALVRRIAADGLVQHRRTLRNLEDLLAILEADKDDLVQERATFIRRERQAGGTT
jgi:hypothetical protein